MVVSRITDIFIKSREKEMNTARPIDNDEEVPLKDCLSCRLIGGFGCTALGLFAIYEPHRKRMTIKSKDRPPIVKLLPPRIKFLAYRLIGVTFIGLGGLRLAGLHLQDIHNFIEEGIPRLPLGKKTD